MQVIGFAGPARVGKTFTTEALKTQAEAAGWAVVVLPFAKPLKDEAAARGFGKEEKPEEYRKFCQEYGAEMRATDENYWLKAWRAALIVVRDEHFDDDDCRLPLLVIADDVRYENELDAITDAGGYTFFIHPGDRELPEASAAWRTHESEMLANTMIGNPTLATQNFDFVMYNNLDSAEITTWAKAAMKLVISHPGDRSDYCDCEGCNSSMENRPVNADQIMKELDDLMDDINRREDEREDDDNDN